MRWNCFTRFWKCHCSRRAGKFHDVNVAAEVDDVSRRDDKHLTQDRRRQECIAPVGVAIFTKSHAEPNVEREIDSVKQGEAEKERV